MRRLRFAGWGHGVFAVLRLSVCLSVGMSGLLVSPYALAQQDASPTTAPTTEPTKLTEPRLVVLAPHLVELLYSIDAGELIVGTVEHADYPAAARQLPRLGNYAGLQLEAVLASKPDLVLYWQSGSPAADIQALQQLGIRTLGFEPQQLDDIATDLERLGELTGRQPQAARQVAGFRAELAQLRNRYQQQSPLTVFYELWDDPLSTIGAKAWPARALEVCGAVNIFADASSPYPQVSAETVLSRQPQLILQPVSANEPRQLVAWQQQFGALSAVRLQQLAQPDADLLHRATLRTLQGVQQLCQQVEQSRQFYQRQPASSAR